MTLNYSASGNDAATALLSGSVEFTGNSMDQSIKAQIAGLRLGEVPIVSIDRLYGGKSTFRLGPWTVEYFRWFVWGVKELRKNHRRGVDVARPLQRRRDRAHRDELLARTRAGVHVHDPSVDARDTRALRLLQRDRAARLQRQSGCLHHLVRRRTRTTCAQLAKRIAAVIPTGRSVENPYGLRGVRAFALNCNKDLNDVGEHICLPLSAGGLPLLRSSSSIRIELRRNPARGV